MANLQFWRSREKSDTSFLDLVKRTFGKTFTTGLEAKTWLTTNGYYTSYPDIVTDGLVLSLDASNLSSFKGEPTTNIAIDTLIEGGWPGYYTLVNSNTKTFDITITDDWASGTGAWRSYYYNVSAYIGQTLTISANFKIISETNAAFQFIMIGQGNNTGNPDYLPSSIAADRNEKTSRISENITWTGVINSTGIIGFTLSLSDMSRVANFKARLSNVQVEVKTYATPFINGTRGTTFATGGGWCDLSGNGNHGELVNTPLYDSSNLGNVVFDGISDSILLNNFNLTNFTCNVWFNGTSGYIFRKNGYGWGLFISSAGNLSTWVDTDTNHRSTTQTFEYSGITNITITFGSSTFTVYKNGQYVSSVGTSANSVYATLNTFMMGTDGGASGFLVGSIYLLNAYNRALSASEITQNFNATKERFGL